MPLRDHFSKKTPRRYRWEGFHSQWASTIVRRLNRHLLPANYHAEPRIRLGTDVEVDVGSLRDNSLQALSTSETEGAVGLYAPPEPVMTLAADLSQEDSFEVLVFDESHDTTLVAAIELISPANKDRPQSREDFVVKCARMLKARVSLILVDIVTERRANLFEELLAYLEIADPPNPIAGQVLYACSMLPTGVNGDANVRVWPALLQVNEPLPTLPLWLTAERAVPFEMEKTYEDTCADLRG